MTTFNVNETAGCNSTTGSSPAVAGCEARDLKCILTHLADQIADADRRHSQVLNQMQERLGQLGGATVGLRDQLPRHEEASGVLDRIESGMAELSDRLAESEPRGPAPAAPASSAVEAAPALRSALAGQARDAYERRSVRSPVVDNFDVVDTAGAHREDDAWERETVDPLARLYETGAVDELGVPVLDPVSAPGVNPKALTAALSPEAPERAAPLLMASPGVSPTADFAPLPPAPSELAPAPVSAPASVVPRGTGLQAVADTPSATPAPAGDRQWLESRLAEVAGRIAQMSAPAPVGKAELAAEVVARQSETLAGERAWLEQRFAEVAERIANVPSAPEPVSKSEIAAEVIAQQTRILQESREWMESRIADLAARLEQTVASVKPGPGAEVVEARFNDIEQALQGLAAIDPMAAVEERFAALETRLTETMAGTAKRADLASLMSIEAQVEDLNAHLVTVETHFSRLDSIELELRSLAQRMSPTELGKLIEQRTAYAPDEEALAGTVASRVAREVAQEMPRFETALQTIADRLSADKLASLVAQIRPAAPDTAAIAAQVAEHISLAMPRPDAATVDATQQLEDLKATLEAFVVEQRHGDEQTTTMLDTMQQAMIRLLDRMDAIEQARQAAIEEQAYDDIDAGSRDDRRAPASSPDYGPALGSVRSTGERRHEAPADGFEVRQPAVAPVYMEQPRAEPEPPRAAPARAAPAVVQTPEPEQPVAGSREDYIAAARRAARMASEAQSEAVQQPEETKARTVKPEGGRRQLSRTSMALICLLLVGASFVAVKSTILAPSAPVPQAPQAASAPQRAATPDPAGTTSAAGAAEKKLQGLEDADVIIEDGARDAPARGAPGQAPAQAPQRRSSLLGNESLGMDGFSAVLNDLERRQLASSAPTHPAALTREQPGGAAGPRANDALPLSIGPNSLRAAAAKGDASAEFEIGARFAEGRGVTQDLQQAVNWYQRAASQGFAPAQYRLGSMFERGLGVKADAARARVWYQRAAEQGIVKAMHNLAVLTAGRDASATDYGTAARWFRAAADHGLTDSQFNLAIMHDSGLGMERNAKEAYKWFSLAARAGDDEASRRRESLRQKMQPQEVAEVEAELAKWRPKTADQAVNDPRTAGEAWKSRAR
jgi:localization factor PodJL